MKVSLEGYGARYVTLLLEGSVQTGMPVQLCGNNTVKAAADGGVFFGTALSVRDGYVLVQTQGCQTSTYSGTAPTHGRGALAADGAGGVKTLASGRPVDIVAVDNTAKTVTFLF